MAPLRITAEASEHLCGALAMNGDENDGTIDRRRLRRSDVGPIACGCAGAHLALRTREPGRNARRDPCPTAKSRAAIRSTELAARNHGAGATSRSPWTRCSAHYRRSSRSAAAGTNINRTSTSTDGDGSGGKRPTHWMVPSGGERQGADVPQRRFTYGATMIRFALTGLAGLASKAAQAQPLPLSEIEEEQYAGSSGWCVRYASLPLPRRLWR